jgi:hypothetical protein
LTLAEGIVERHFARRRDGTRVTDATISGLADAVRQSREQAETLAAFVDATKKDETTPLAARRLTIRTRAEHAKDRLASVIDAARDKALAEVQRLERDTASPAITSPLAGEIRGRLAAMSPDARNAALDAALKDGADAVLAAVLAPDVPTMLTGLSASELAMKRAAYRRAHHPMETDRIERLRRAVRATEIAGEAGWAFFTQLVDDPEAALAEANRKAAADAQAALDERAA